MQNGQRSISDLTRDAAFHLGDMFRNELKLARVEATDSVKSMTGGIFLVAASAAVAASALTIGMLAVVYALSGQMPMWAGAAICAGVGVLLAVLLFAAGRSALNARSISLPRTRDQVSRDIKTFSEHIH